MGSRIHGLPLVAGTIWFLLVAGPSSAQSPIQLDGTSGDRGAIELTDSNSTLAGDQFAITPEPRNRVREELSLQLRSFRSSHGRRRRNVFRRRSEQHRRSSDRFGGLGRSTDGSKRTPISSC